MGWKEFFYFNKSQRIGILSLAVLIVIALLTTILMPYFIKPREMDDGAAFLEEAREFRANLIEKERSQRQEREFYPFEYRDYPKNRKTFETPYTLFAFDPNTADSATFVKLGLKPFVARNILRYRSKGGSFKSPDAFAKVYGITSEKFDEMKPYIQIAGTKNGDGTITSEAKEATTKTANPQSDETTNIPKVVELNSADTAILLDVKGIGRTYAKRVVGYGRVLGGYVSVEQLKEVYGMTDENYMRISPHLSVDPSLTTKIDVNKASIEKLKKHPYIKTFQRAKAIYEYRRKKVKLQDISQLKHLDEFTEEDWKKLEPYLEFK
ncbi:MAG: ComEA family DNA-binding protein [Paludibacteraceae bacterium]